MTNYSNNSHQYSSIILLNIPVLVSNSVDNLVNTDYTNRCCLITGPNGAGKSIYLKQIGIIVYLAHIGFHVPSEAAEIPLFDRIAVVPKSQSAIKKEAGLSQELEWFARLTATEFSTSKTFFLIDEMATAVSNPIAQRLLYCVVRRLTSPQCFAVNHHLQRFGDSFTVPYSLIVTHLTELLISKQVKQSHTIRFLTLQGQENGNFTHKVKPGLITKGYGIKAAASILNADLIQEAKFHLKQIRAKFTLSKIFQKDITDQQSQCQLTALPFSSMNSLMPKGVPKNGKRLNNQILAQQSLIHLKSAASSPKNNEKHSPNQKKGPLNCQFGNSSYISDSLSHLQQSATFKSLSSIKVSQLPSQIRILNLSIGSINNWHDEPLSQGADELLSQLKAATNIVASNPSQR